MALRESQVHLVMAEQELKETKDQQDQGAIEDPREMPVPAKGGIDNLNNELCPIAHA